jgi:serine/threonine protein kinase
MNLDPSQQDVRKLSCARENLHLRHLRASFGLQRSCRAASAVRTIPRLGADSRRHVGEKSWTIHCRANVPQLPPLKACSRQPMPTPTGNLVTHADAMIGEILGGRYLVERLIDRGGMGLVYLATEVAAERHVVVKMLAPHWTEDADAVARFDREGERLAELKHPNIVEMFDVGRAGEQAFIAMEYIEGEPLRRYLKRNERTSLREFGPIAAQVLSAVGYAHAHEIMLRDIKPSNIMLCERDGKASFVKLLDFGLAKLVGGDDVEITKAHVVGTAGYLSPEQIKGEAIDVRVDVYALGVLFFVMLTGKSPIQGDNDAALLYNHVHGAPRRLADELPAGEEVPEGLLELVHKCLEKDPNKRPADASAVAELLSACLPAEVLALPDATAQTREVIRDYRDAKLGIVKDDADNAEEDDGLSGEWTRPVLRKPIVGDASPVVQAGTWKNLTQAAQAAAAKNPARSIRAAVRSGGVAKKPGNPTRVGLPAVASAEQPAPVTRKPPPAKLEPRRAIRRTGPRKIVRATASHAAVDRSKPGRGVEMTRPAGSGHVGAKERGLTRPDGSGHVREDRGRPAGPPAAPRAAAPIAAPPAPPAPPPVPGPVVPVSAYVEQPADPGPPVPQSGPMAVASDDSIPIIVERERSLKVLILVGTFMIVALGTFAIVAFWLPSKESAPIEGERDLPVGSPPVEADVGSAPADVPEAPILQPMAQLELTGPQGAQVRIDDELHGELPLQLELPVGRHRLEVTSPRHEPWQTEVELVAGENPPLTAEMVARERPAGARRLPKEPTREDRGVAAAVPEPTPRDAAPPKPPPVEKPTSRNNDDFIPSSRDDDDPFLPVGKKK